MYAINRVPPNAAAHAQIFAVHSVLASVHATLGCSFREAGCSQNMKGDAPVYAAAVMDWTDLQPRYEELGFLGRGAYGTVFKARDKFTGSIVALKFINRQVGEFSLAHNEVLSLMHLRHPHITELQEVFLTNDHLVLVLQYYAGGTLADLLDQSKKGLPAEQAQWIFTQLLCALDYCHSKGIASRDIKPENILLDRRISPGVNSLPCVKLIDFGHAARCETQPLHTDVCGTPAYFPPEVVLAGMGGPPYDAKKADVWSCGALLYAMFTCSSPFQQPQDSKLGHGASLAVLLERIIKLEYSLPPWLPPEAKDIIRSMLEPDPGQRPSISELLDHPWCLKGLAPGQLRAYNASLLARDLASPAPPELLREVCSVLDEAAMPPAKPPASPRGVEAQADGGSLASSVDTML